MPHFIIDCSEDIIIQKSLEEIMQAVYETAEATGLFAKNDKMRIHPLPFIVNHDFKEIIFGQISHKRTFTMKIHS